VKIGSLFTGTGALDMAARAVLGGELTWVSDIKPAAQTFLSHRHPDVPNIGDLVRLFPAVGLMSREAHDLAIDILVGGWPCQPHSSAGRRLGEADPRALWPNVLRVIAELRPRVFFGENVARIASNGELQRVVRSLAALGYVGAWRSVPAAQVGAPHRRDRLFLVALRADATVDPGGQLVRDEPGRSGGPGGTGARVAGDHGQERAPGLTPLPTPTPTQSMTTGAGTSGREGGFSLQTAIAYLPTPAVADARNTRNATAGRTPENDRHHSGWTLSDVAFADRWGRYARAIAQWEPVVGRPAPDPTVPSERTGKPVLSPAFVEWMMGLPRGHVTDVPGLRRTQMLSMLGDGVVPLQAEVAYRTLFEALGAAQGAVRAA
jgi:DNA (cytosine-5)-methyltransferase 1